MPIEIRHATTTGPIDEPQWNEGHTITGLAAIAESGAWADLVSVPAPIAETTAAFTTAQQSKLGGIAAGATVNAADAALRDRESHTGSQAASTISDFAATARAEVEAMLVEGSGVSLTPSGSGAERQLVIAASGGGGGGSGDVVGPASATDGALAAFDGITGKLLKAGAITLAEAIALRDEVIAARGDRANLNNRISTIADFSSPNAGGVIVGRHYDQAMHAANATTIPGVANRVDLTPYHASAAMRINLIGVNVTTLIASALGRCCIYSDLNGWPDELLYEGAGDLDFGSTGFKSHSLDLVLENGRKYWLGIRHSSTATLSAVPATSLVNFGLTTGTATAYGNIIRRTLAFATPLPSTWGFDPGEITNTANGTSIRIRAAAL